MISKVIRITGLVLILLASGAGILLSDTSYFRDISNNPNASEFDKKMFKISNFASFFEGRFFDIRSSITIKKDKAIDQNMVLATIDDESIQKIGRFPWTRTVYVQLLDKLKSFGAKIVGFDVFFYEPERSFDGIEPDTEFAKAIARFQEKDGNRVIIPYSKGDPERIDDLYKDLPEQLYSFLFTAKENGSLFYIPLGKSQFPTPKIANIENLGLAYIGAVSDGDGIFRHYPTIINFPQVEEISEGQKEIINFYLPTFSLLTYMLYTGDQPNLEIFPNLGGLLKIKNGSLTLNNAGESKIRWSGGPKIFKNVKIIDILNAKDDDEKMKNTFNEKIVFIASTAFGAHDFRHTPVDSQLPGIYYHMNLLKMLLDGKFYKPQDDSAKLSWSILAIGSVLMIGMMLFGNAIADLFTMILLSTGVFLLDTYYLIPQGYEVKLFYCMFSIISCYSWTTFLNFYLTSKEKAKIKGTFSRYVSPSIVNEMLSDPSKLKVGGQKKNITVFFSDVRDFTSISEKLTPEQLSTCLNQYMGKMTDIIFENYGTLDKYIGDAIVAFWGAPVDVENHAYHAVKASLQMIEVLPQINEDFKKQDFPLFKHGIGLNTGECSVGNMGSDQIFAYTALGDNMNLGARLEALCKFYGVQLNISEYTLNAIPENLRSEFTYRLLDKVRVKGKTEPVTIYEVFHSTHSFKIDDDALKEYNKGLDLYYSQNFSAAKNIFHDLHVKYPEDKASKRFMENCQNFIDVPPTPDWDGVHTHTTKG